MDRQKMLAIETKSLSKDFGTTRAVRKISFQVERGEIFGFLGPNGAGKTTTIKMLTTLIPATGGEVHVLGYDIGREGKKIRTRIGVVQQGESYEYSKRVDEALDIYGALWGLPKNVRREKIEKLLDVFDLQSHRQKHTQELSIGLRRRLQVAREFIHDMDLLFLDEPTIGLDPMARRGIMEMVRENARRGLTVFLTTQNLGEAEYLCNRIAIVNHGRILITDTPHGLKDRCGGVKTIEVSVNSGDAKLVASHLKGVRGVSATATSEQDDVISIWTTDPSEAFNAIIRLGDELHLTLGSVTLREPTLEQAFINIINKEEEGETPD